MCIKAHIVLLFSFLLLMSCSNAISPEESAIVDNSTHPDVRLNLVKKNKTAQAGDVDFRPIRVSSASAIQLPSASLFNPYRSVGLYQPDIHYQIGDMILVKLEEKTSAKKSLNYKMDKNDQFTLDPVTLNAGPIHVNNNDLNADYAQNKKFGSSAQTAQNNSLTGDIIVYIREILPNGNFAVAGEKWIILNKGEEYLRFSGDIRAQDIASDNTISSVRVGNKHVELSAKGEQQENQDASLLSQFFNILD